MPVYGIIDCGSNTVRLCIYRVTCGKQQASRDSVKTLLNHKKMLGLAADVKEGALTDRGVKRAARAISDHLQVAEHFSCKRIDVFATAFLRNCSNSHEAAERIEMACGAPIAVLSADEEAHLGFAGAHASNPELADGLLMDLGGGSCELTLVREGRDIARTSVPQGSLSLFESCVQDVLPNACECAKVQQTFQDALAASTWSGPGGKGLAPTAKAPFPLPLPRPCNLFGIGGSVRALAKTYAQLQGNSKPEELTRAALEELLQAERQDPGRFTRAVLAQAPDRLHTIVPGLLAVRSVMNAAGARSVRICKWGLREGYLLERMAKPRR